MAALENGHAHHQTRSQSVVVVVLVGTRERLQVVWMSVSPKRTVACARGNGGAAGTEDQYPLSSRCSDWDQWQWTTSGTFLIPCSHPLLHPMDSTTVESNNYDKYLLPGGHLLLSSCPPVDKKISSGGSQQVLCSAE